MSILLQIFVLTVIGFQSVYSEKCNDCISVNACLRAMDLIKIRETKYYELLRNAYCGIKTEGTISTPQVCCSMLSTAEAEEVGASEDQDIARHRNLELLPEDCGRIQMNRIFGGSQRQLYEFPWMALIAKSTVQGGTEFQCGGSIINKRYVLTTAYCAMGKGIVGVRVGEYDISKYLDCDGNVCEKHIQDIPVEESVVHEDFDKSPLIINDIGLLRLAEDIDFNYRNVHRICLPTTSELRRQDVSNQVATLAGWKYNSSFSTIDVLQKTMVPILTSQSCRDLIYKNSSASVATDLIMSKLLCVGGKGDSSVFHGGSPLMLEKYHNNINTYVQYGILSFGPKMENWGRREYPEVYTDVTKYMKWILDNIRP